MGEFNKWLFATQQTTDNTRTHTTHAQVCYLQKYHGCLPFQAHTHTHTHKHAHTRARAYTPQHSLQTCLKSCLPGQAFEVPLEAELAAKDGGAGGSLFPVHRHEDLARLVDQRSGGV